MPLCLISLNDFFASYGQAMLQHTREHVMLTLVAMLIACAVAVPAGVVLSLLRWRWLNSLVMAAVNIVQPIPSLAFVALAMTAILLLNGLLGTSVPTLGVAPALVALVAYALLPILRNTVTGIHGVDPATVEVAKGMGMRWHQVLFSVQLPLAMPVIMAGVRISTVWTVGVATLVSLVGAGGLGELIFRGLGGGDANTRLQLILAGTAPAVLLALTIDWLLGLLERWLSPSAVREN